MDILFQCDALAPAGVPLQGRIVKCEAVAALVDMHRQLVERRGLELAAPRVVFHWTQEQNFNSIIETGLRVPDGAAVTISHGSSFGNGIYVSPDFRYGKELFAYGAPAAFMCLALPGKQHFGKPPAGIASLHAPGNDGYDSVVGREGQRGVDEWVFFNSSQLLPCFLVDRLGLIPAKEAAAAAIRALHRPWTPPSYDPKQLSQTSCGYSKESCESIKPDEMEMGDVLVEQDDVGKEACNPWCRRLRQEASDSHAGGEGARVGRWRKGGRERNTEQVSGEHP